MKLVFVETQNEQAHRNHRAEFLPFAAGLAERLGWQWRWLAIRVPAEHMHVGTRFVVDLPGDRRERLVAAVAAEEPDVIAMKDRPAEPLRRALEGAAPGARLVDLSDEELTRGARREPGRVDSGKTDERRHGHGLGLPSLSVAEMARLLTGRELPAAAEEIASERYLDVSPPRYGRTFPWPEDEAKDRLPVRVLVPVECPYRRSLRKNRFYRDLMEGGEGEHRGCTFCFNALRAREITYRLPLSEVALSQIEACQRDEPEVSGRVTYSFEGNALYPIFSELVAGILDRGLRPCTITGMLRVDQFLRLKEHLEELLPRLEAAGHGLRLLSMGAENFSPDENERFNKGLSVEQLESAHEQFVALEERFPETFERDDAATFAGILFTPWTRPKDLLPNIDAARRLGSQWLETVIGTRLQLRPGLPITALARRDGLTAEEHGSGADVEAVCLSSPDETEVPWRFKDPRTERIHELLIRLEPIPFQVNVAPDEALVSEIREARARLPESLRRDYVGLAEAVVRTVAEIGPEASVPELFARVARNALLEHGLYDPEKGLDEHGVALMVRILGALVPRNEKHLRGYRFVEATPVSQGGAYWARVMLERGGRELRFDVAGRFAENDYWLEEERFAVVFEPGHEPAKDELAAARVALRLAERAFPRQKKVTGHP